MRAALLTLMGWLLLPHHLSADSTGSIKVAWDLSWEPGIAGYRVHYGTKSADYSDIVDVGYEITAELPNLTPGVTYYSAVTAYNEFGLESEYSNEISFTVTAPEATDSDNDGLSDFFEASYGNGEDIDPLSDLDGDGLIALVEFAHGLDPTSPLKTPIIEFETIVIQEERYFCLRYLIDPQAIQFVSIVAERTTDPSTPSSWQAKQTVRISSSASIEHPHLMEVVERSVFPISDQVMELFRIQYSHLMPDES
jgi:hypothetical protein